VFQPWIEDLLSRPGAEAVLFGVMALLLVIYIWSATEIRRSHERRMRRIRDTLYISTTLLGKLTILEHQKYPFPENEQHELLMAMLACKSASGLSSPLQDQIRDCIKEHDPARLSLMQRALERECTALSDELGQDTRTDHWGQAIWTIFRPLAEPAALAATLFLFADLVFRQRLLDVSAASWESVLPWLRAVSLMITIMYGYLLWTSMRRDTSGTVTKILSLLIVLCSLLHLIGLAAAPYALGLQLVFFVSGFGFTGTRPRSDRPYAGHTELEPTKETSAELEVNPTRKTSTHTGE